MSLLGNYLKGAFSEKLVLPRVLVVGLNVSDPPDVPIGSVSTSKGPEQYVIRVDHDTIATVDFTREQPMVSENHIAKRRPIFPQGQPVSLVLWNRNQLVLGEVVDRLHDNRAAQEELPGLPVTETHPAEGIEVTLGQDPIDIPTIGLNELQKPAHIPLVLG